MARWKLTEPHYLNVPGTEWEQVLNDRITQRPIRHKYPVPMHLDPRIESDWNYRDPLNPMDGEIHVAWANGRQGAKDIIFIGDPTPGMFPLDEEAREISAKFKWTPTVAVTDQAWEASNQSVILNTLIKQLAEATVAGQSPAPAGFEKFMEAMATMMNQQTQLLAQILGKQQEVEFVKQAEALGATRAEPDEPLLDLEPPTKEELEASAQAARTAEAVSIEKANARAASRRV